MDTVHDVTLTGCSPEPLFGYLKALGVLRLIAEQKDPRARGYWEADRFHLVSFLSPDEILRFFVDEYRPTPILAPWNGASGFWDSTTANKTLVVVRDSTNPRLEEYRKTIRVAEGLLKDMGLRDTPVGEKKAAVLRACRALFPDSAIRWLDAAYLLTEDKPRFAAVLGTGGNDGKLDFTNNLMQNLLRVMDANAGVSGQGGGKKPSRAKRVDPAEAPLARLEMALFQRGMATLAVTAVGQFHPGGVGGPNGIQGFEADSLVNPWDFVFMLEGAVFLAGAAVWRLGTAHRGQAAFPFTVYTSAAGWGSLDDGVKSSARGELWLPLWPHPATVRELERLFGEGRAQVGRRQARDGLDFARAVAGLGIDRGIQAFQRYGFLQRSGKAYLAAPLGRLPVRARTEVGLLQETDQWLDSLRRVAGGENAPASIKRSVRRIEDAIFAYCQRGGALALQDVLVALGRAEQYLANSPKLHEKVRPLQGLSVRWLHACDDGSAEFRLAAAVASINDKTVGPVRTNLEPVARSKGRRFAWIKDNPDVVWHGNNTVWNLAAVLERRRLMGEHASQRTLPIAGRLSTPLDDVAAFLNGNLDEDRLGDLIWAFAALEWDRFKNADLPWWRMGPIPAKLPRAYVVLKLLFLPKGLPIEGATGPILVKPEPGVMAALRVGDLDRAVGVAARRLRATGIQLLGQTRRSGPGLPDFVVSHEVRSHLAAAMLVPVRITDELVSTVVRPKRNTTETA